MSAPKDVEITDSPSRSQVQISLKKERKKEKMKDCPSMETSSKQIHILNGLELMNAFHLKEPR